MNRKGTERYSKRGLGPSDQKRDPCFFENPQGKLNKHFPVQEKEGLRVASLYKVNFLETLENGGRKAGIQWCHGDDAKIERFGEYY